MESAMGLFGIFGFLFSVLPLIFAIILIRWTFIIKQNSDEQVRQNREIISLLKQKGNMDKFDG